MSRIQKQLRQQIIADVLFKNTSRQFLNKLGCEYLAQLIMMEEDKYEPKKSSTSIDPIKSSPPRTVGRKEQTELAEKLRIAVENEMSNNPFRHFLHWASGLLHAMCRNTLSLAGCKRHCGCTAFEADIFSLQTVFLSKHRNGLGLKIQKTPKCIPNI